MKIQAVILAGGLGTRIRSLYPDRPKALIPIAGKPFLQWQIEWLMGLGITKL
ncbi:MAG: NTP transferase domain-containing protein, partial [Kiritimatiellia bacterium]